MVFTLVMFFFCSGGKGQPCRQGTLEDQGQTADQMQGVLRPQERQGQKGGRGSEDPRREGAEGAGAEKDRRREDPRGAGTEAESRRGAMGAEPRGTGAAEGGEEVQGPDDHDHLPHSLLGFCAKHCASGTVSALV